MELRWPECGPLARSCALALIGLLAICLLSRMSASGTLLGAHGRGQVLHIVRRLTSEGEAQAQMSKQDQDPFVGLVHNVEAAARLRTAKCLLEETGSENDCNLVDRLAELVEEQEALIRLLMDRVDP